MGQNGPYNFNMANRVEGEVYFLRNNERIKATTGLVNINNEWKRIAIYWKPNSVSKFTIVLNKSIL